VAGWLHTEVNVRHRELNLDTVSHLSTNRARCRLTSFIVELRYCDNSNEDLHPVQYTTSQHCWLSGRRQGRHQNCSMLCIVHYRCAQS